MAGMRLASLVFLAACTTGSSDSTPTPTGRCTALENKTFASLTQGECGLGPDGPEPCTWHLMFSASTPTTTHYDWQHSDYGQSGEIACDGADVTEVTGGSDQPRGTYDAATQQLVWDGVTYQP
jgi:hypothetical protein